MHLQIVKVYTASMPVFQLALIQRLWIGEMGRSQKRPPINGGFVWQHDGASSALPIRTRREPLSIRTVFPVDAIAIKTDKIIRGRITVIVIVPVNCTGHLRANAANGEIPPTGSHRSPALAAYGSSVPCGSASEARSPCALRNDLLGCCHIPEHGGHAAPSVTRTLATTILCLEVCVCLHAIIKRSARPTPVRSDCIISIC